MRSQLFRTFGSGRSYVAQVTSSPARRLWGRRFVCAKAAQVEASAADAGFIAGGLADERCRPGAPCPSGRFPVAGEREAPESAAGALGAEGRTPAGGAVRGVRPCAEARRRDRAGAAGGVGGGQ